MTDNDLNISRRSALAALGSIGVASAGAGLGTSAFFSDTESFENNQLVAGELDLKMDWEEHYSDWSDDESADFDETGTKYAIDDYPDESGTGDFQVLMEDPATDGNSNTNPANYTPFPPTASSPLIWVPNAYVDDFMANTSLEAYPDSDNNGISEYPIGDMIDSDRTECDFLADVGADDDGLDPAGLRTDNDDTNDGSGNGLPLINLQDVKPGDFGEITFSTHLCGNPGYLWMNMPGGLTESENGVNDPEADSPDEDADGEYPDGATGIPGEPELAENIQTAIWYDNNCNNLFDGEVEPVDIMVVVDKSGSIEEDQMDALKNAANFFAESLPRGDLPNSSEPVVRTGLISFSEFDPAAEGVPLNLASPQEPLGPVDQFLDSNGNGEVGELLPVAGTGNTPMPHALDLAREVLNAEGRSNANQYILFLSDGAPGYKFESQYPLQDPEDTLDTTDGVTTTVSGSSTSFDDVVTDPGGNPYISDIFHDGNLDDMEDETLLVARDIDTGPQNNTIRNGNPISGDDGIDILTVALQSPNISASEQNDLNSLMEAIATNSGLSFEAPFSLPALKITIQDILEAILVLEGEEVIFQGTLKQAETVLTDGNGIPLDGNRIDSDFDELNDPDDDQDRECFSGTNCFGLAWWVPPTVGNEIQGDSVEFDLGFYTEQCRHNDGSGMATETPTGTPSGGTSQSVTLTPSRSDGFIDASITIGSEDDGETLTEIIFDFPSGGPVDISNVGDGDVSSSNGSVDSASGSNNGTTLTLDINNAGTLGAGDTINVGINDVGFSNQSQTDVDVDVTVNTDGPTTTTMTVSGPP